MAVEKDQSDWLPEPPPARPAAREAAIGAALRKFDGAADAAPVAAAPAQPSWTRKHRPQLGLAVASMLILVIGIPAAFIGLRNEAPSPAPSAPSAVVQQSTVAPPVTQLPANVQPAPKARFEPAAPPTETLAEPAPVQTKKTLGPAIEAKSEPVAEASPPVVTAAPPPPAPPPPPAMANSEQATAPASAQGIIVTGARIPQPNLPTRQQRLADKATDRLATDAKAEERAYGEFLSNLQAAVRADDRRAVTRLIAFPLRVNYPGGARSYPDRRSVDRDYAQIFTPKVRQAILSQRAAELFVRDQGAMIGNGELWFRETCPNASCSPAGAVRIVTVNP